MSLREFAEQELDAIGLISDGTESDINGWMRNNVLELLEVFSKQGHSGASAAYLTSILEKLLRYEPLAPLTGEASEWVEVAEQNGMPLFQNKRCGRIFREGIDGLAYDIDGKVFVEPDGCAYTSIDSRVPVTFPYTPVTEYVPVEKLDTDEENKL